MAAGQEVTGADESETHRVLLSARDPLDATGIRDLVPAGVGGDVHSVVSRIDAEAVDLPQRGRR